jgi:hypothetical protein
VDAGEAQRIKGQKEAGGTLALTGQLLAQGKTPEHIAVERGLAISTIYSHLAQLIAQGQVQIDAVVPGEVQRQIRASIEAVGSVQYLAPIKARLPETIDYNVIRCVTNAWLIEHGQPLPEAKVKRAPDVSTVDSQLFERLRAWRLDKARMLRLPPYTICDDEALRGVSSVKPCSVKELLAIRGIGQVTVDKYGAELLALVGATPAQRAAVQLTDRPVDQSPIDPVADFLSRPHPRMLKGPWLAGWALDFHSRYDGDTASRSSVGDRVFRYKYGGERQLAPELAKRWVELLAAHPALPKFDAVLPVPPSMHRDFDPVSNLAQALAAQLQVPLLANGLIKTRVTRPQKEMTSLAQKRANVAGAFALKNDVCGKCLILIDDLYDSGATLEEAAKVLARGGVSGLVVLTLTRTIHSDA